MSENYRWEQDGAGGDHGTLTLWPGTAREMSLVVQSFPIAFKLAESIRAVTTDAHWRGRKSMHDDIVRMRP